MKQTHEPKNDMIQTGTITFSEQMKARRTILPQRPTPSTQQTD
jgi:hypothetical protein